MATGEVIIGALIAHYYIAAIIAGLLGEEYIMFVAFLGGSSIKNLMISYIAGMIGLAIANSIYYIMGLLRVSKKLGIKIHEWGNGHGIVPWLIRCSDNSPFKALVWSKFVYGTRTPLMIYYGARGMRYLKFITYDLLANLIWSPFIILAWLAGKGVISSGLDIFHDFSKIVGIAVLFMIAIFVIGKIIRHFIHKKCKRKKY